MLILEALRKRVAETPNKICLSSPEEKITFLELENYSNGIAKNLVSLTSKDVVPMYIKNDINVLPTVLGIIKAGKIPLPLITGLALNRALSRVEDVDFDLIIVSQEERENLEGNIKIYVLPQELSSLKVENFEKRFLEEAYIICTSGTTGVSKKVFLTQENLSWLLEEFSKINLFTKTDRFLFTTPYTFDVSISEIFMPIFEGGELFCFSNQLTDEEKMTSVIPYIKNFQITHLSLSPSYVELLLELADTEDFSSLKYLGLAGELVTPFLASKLFPIIQNGTKVFNLYGPSETTIYATSYQLTGEEKSHVPIGLPLSGVVLRVLDEEGQESKKGELLIGGKGVSQGYTLQPILSKEKFIKREGIIYYRTGDYVYYDNVGNLVFENRKDNQVQVNGIRVELEEIDSIVGAISCIKVCRSVYENKRIFIFYQSNEKKEKVRSEILEVLPKYLNPVLVGTDEFLLNQNRKFDSKRMIEKYYFQDKNQERRDKFQSKLNKILSLFKVNEFEELDSLDTVRFFIEIEEEFGIKIKENMFFSFSNLSQIIDFIEECGNDKEIQPLHVGNEVEKINLQISMETSLKGENLETKLIPTLYHQKTYDLKKYNSLLYCDLKVDIIDYNFVLKVKRFFKNLSNKVDSLRFVLVQKEDLYFQKVKEEDFNPVVFVVESSLSDDFVKKLLYNKKGVYQFMVIIHHKEQLVRVYFSHHIMDKSSLFKISKWMKEYLLDDKEIGHNWDTSYENYIEFVKKANNNLTIENALKMIPITEVELYTQKSKTRNMQILKSKPLFANSMDIAIESFYKFSQGVFDEVDCSIVTGAMTANIRKFESFNATDIIGDTHLTLPIHISRTSNFSSYRKNILSIIDSYKKGLNIKDKIFEGYPKFSENYGIAKDRWDNMNAIVNYIGEISDVEGTLEDIKNTGFDTNYMVVFTHKRELYQVIFNGALVQKEYFVDMIGENVLVTVSNYKSE